MAELVAEETEDKSLGWMERKTITLKKLETAGLDSKILALGDKLSNLRCTARDRMEIGEKVWERFRQKEQVRHRYAGTGDRTVSGSRNH